MESVRVERGSAICEYSYRAGQMFGRVYGPVTTSTHRLICVDVVRLSRRWSVWSVAIDYRWAVILMPFEDLNATPDHVPQDVMQRPAALILPAPSLSMFREYAWAQAMRGVIRGAFLDLDRGRDWADAKAKCRTPASAR